MILEFGEEYLHEYNEYCFFGGCCCFDAFCDAFGAELAGLSLGPVDCSGRRAPPRDVRPTPRCDAPAVAVPRLDIVMALTNVCKEGSEYRSKSQVAMDD